MLTRPLVIFDCDGVIVDSDTLALRIQSEELRKLGIEMSYDECLREFLGIGMSATLRKVEARFGGPLPATWEPGLVARVVEAFRSDLRPVEGIEDALDAIDTPTCIASGGSHEKMQFTLGLTGLYERFRGRIFSATEVPLPKPAPDLFLHAARTTGFEPSECVVVEDSPAGVSAARSAGMRVLGYAASTPPSWLKDATKVFSDMRELPALVEQVFGDEDSYARG